MERDKKIRTVIDDRLRTPLIRCVLKASSIRHRRIQRKSPPNKSMGG
jgi:hypothetical protein